MSEIYHFLVNFIPNLEGSDIPSYLIFLAFSFVSIVLGNIGPKLLRLLFYRFLPKQGQEIYETLTQPLQGELKTATTLILINLSLVWLEEYRPVYNFILPFMELAVTISVAWLLSRLFRQFMRGYGISFMQRVGLEADELVLPFELVVNILIGVFAAIAFARTRNIDLFGLLASLGFIAGAIGLAANNALSQMIGTVVIYLDRPFSRGEYIRLPNGIYGRVESIGLRSTKIRTAAKSTLMIIPNSKLADWEIENITRGKKVMVLLYLDFLHFLKEQEQAMVEQIVKAATDSITGIDPGSTKISLVSVEGKPGTRARVTFFILGSNEDSIQLRKRLLELANENISKQLAGYGLEFVTQDPTVYIESPVTI
ncbi:mechanosensitive ion channel family protein [Spirulina subsalsa FACHB-351]|uniref:Mechanosensitive ion channel family protein n=1 Tax=Spirulina subsalsa FACHB-351 TaxID=234711 RepID=A0ABT3L9T2_9CYAN|nr:mechanosensitive ion channel family protein [Spirulina subsalsa]MCW6038264.1 mechanosensitive ion channel family protein [Spirulina subsalsa FACHB-351]